MSTRTTPALIAVLVVITASLSVTLAAPAHKVYLPTVACADCAGSGGSVNPSPVPSPVPTNPPAAPDLAAYRARMVELVNQARAAFGCPLVTPNAYLMERTQAWSETIVATGNAVHAPGGWYDGYPGGGGENLDGAETPDYAFQNWMASPAHRYRIEASCYSTSDPSYDPARIYEIGIGFKSGVWTLFVGDRLP